MVLLNSEDEFFSELEHMFEFCKERGAGTVYITLKKVEGGSKQKAGAGRDKGAGGGGRREGWLARAKISNKKARKISVLVRRDVGGGLSGIMVNLRKYWHPIAFDRAVGGHQYVGTTGGETDTHNSRV